MIGAMNVTEKYKCNIWSSSSAYTSRVGLRL